MYRLPVPYTLRAFTSSKSFEQNLKVFMLVPSPPIRELEKCRDRDLIEVIDNQISSPTIAFIHSLLPYIRRLSHVNAYQYVPNSIISHRQKLACFCNVARLISSHALSYIYLLMSPTAFPTEMNPFNCSKCRGSRRRHCHFHCIPSPSL